MIKTGKINSIMNFCRQADAMASFVLKRDNFKNYGQPKRAPVWSLNAELAKNRPRRHDTATKAGVTVQSWHRKGAVIYVGGNHFYPVANFLESKILINGLIKVNQ